MCEIKVKEIENDERYYFFLARIDEEVNQTQKVQHWTLGAIWARSVEAFT